MNFDGGTWIAPRLRHFVPRLHELTLHPNTNIIDHNHLPSYGSQIDPALELTLKKRDDALRWRLRMISETNVINLSRHLATKNILLDDDDTINISRSMARDAAQ